MENNFFVGNIYHRRKIKFSYIEQVVLYSEDYDYYFDLLGEKWYSTDTTKKDYVIKDSLVTTNIEDYKIDYLYLFEKNKTKIKIKNKSTKK